MLSLADLNQDGVATRTVMTVNGSGGRGLYLQREFDALDVDQGDTVVVTVEEDAGEVIIQVPSEK